MSRKEHLTLEGIHKILAIKASMNWGLSDQLEKKFPKVNPVSRPIIVDQTIKYPHWLAGFITGESTFSISIFKSTTKVGYAVKLIFRITQHSRDVELMKSLIGYLDCGRYVAGPLTKNYGDYIVSNLPDIIEKIIPFLNKYSVMGNKYLDYSDFREAAFIMKSKGHTTKEGLEKIIQIKEGMNKGRNN
uniref:Homing endonuclease LAGLIDADG domain-containing protein n=1 Tax=Dactylella sp. TaxID=1814903 RepID=A0A482DQQ0_9PEZI|nr:hypothetical protein [Dactylella sp.]